MVWCGVHLGAIFKMRSSVDFSGRPFHFIGIGGIGMSALAYILTKRKLPVLGSDLRSSPITQQLQALGAHIFWGQSAENLNFCSSEQNLLPQPEFAEALSAVGAKQEVSRAKSNAQLETAALDQRSLLPQVICSTAIQADNPEYRAALELGCPIFHRSDLLAALMQGYQSIAVAGTHGKTTTSSLIGYLLLEAGLDPTIIVGGEVKAWEGNARLGESPYLVAEADESDGSLVKFAAQIGVITNIELDHPDHYKTLAEVVQTFQTFAERSQVIVASLDCPVVQECILKDVSAKHLLTYSLESSSGADFTVDAVQYHAEGTTAQVWERGECLGTLNSKLLGQHNLSNALAAVAVGRHLEIPFATIAQAIASFEGAKRRFELRGEHHGIRFIDDYAHHPSEIQATLKAARLQIEAADSQGCSWKRLVAVFQPHRFSRAQTFLTEFSQSFGDADVVVVTDIYSAGEPDRGLINTQRLVESIARYHQNIHYQPSLLAVIEFLEQSLLPGDLVVFLGAGNLNQTIPELVAFYKATEGQQIQEGVA